MSKPNPQDIANAIGALPLCKKGQAGVTKLIKSLGFELETKREPSAGQIWAGSAGTPDYIYTDKNTFIQLSSGRTDKSPLRCFTYIALNIEDYIKDQKGEG